MNRLERIEKERELKAISWDELSNDLPINGNSLRMGFRRKSVKESFLDVLETKLGLTQFKDKIAKETQLALLDLSNYPDHLIIEYISKNLDRFKALATFRYVVGIERLNEIEEKLKLFEAEMIRRK